MRNSIVVVRGLRFSYAIDDSLGSLYDEFDLTVGRGATAIVGASGAGKSTLARLLAGHLLPGAGSVEWQFDGGRRPRDVNYMDQVPMNSIFPWQSVRRNIEYPLLRLGWSKSDAVRRAAQLLELFRIADVGSAYPAHVSGGELQRTAIARCVSWSPRGLILDESLSALDPSTKAVVVAALRRLVLDENVTLILITHNAADVEMLADRCITLGGRPPGPVRVLEDRAISRRTDGIPAEEFVIRTSQGATHETV